VAVESSGDIVVADSTIHDPGRVIRFDPTGQNMQTLAVGGNFAFPIGIAVDRVADSSRRIVRIDRTSGDQTVVSTGGSLEAQPAWRYGKRRCVLRTTLARHGESRSLQQTPRCTSDGMTGSTVGRWSAWWLRETCQASIYGWQHCANHARFVLPWITERDTFAFSSR
jgi:hypothetical protein